MTTLHEVLNTPRFSDLELLTEGVDTTHFTLKNVEITETPDVAHFISENTLILTTAMIFKDKQNDLIDFIDSLKAANAVGLGIKTGRFLEKVEDHVIRHAQKIGFPIFNIPDTYSLGGLLQQMTSILWKSQHEELLFALDIQRKFSDLLIQDVHNEVIVNELSKMVKSPIILINPFHRVLNASSHFSHPNNPPEEYVTKVFRSKALREKEEGYFMITNSQGEDIPAALIPVYVHKYFPHYLIVLNPEKIPYPISNFALDQAALILSFVLFKNEKVAESKIIIESEHFKELVDNHLSNTASNEEWNESGYKYGFKETNYYRMVRVYQLDEIDTDNTSRLLQEKSLLTYQWLKWNIDRYSEDAKIIYFPSSFELYILLQEKPEDLNQLLLDMQQKLRLMLPINIGFALGNAFTSWQQIDKTYTQANLAFDELKQSSTREPIVYYQDKGILQLFNHLDAGDVQYFCQTVLKDFAYPEDPNLIELRKTLEVFLNCQGEIARTASKLYIHRNTVKYRINRCEEILGSDITTPEESLNIRLALALSKQYHS